jgi:hypothetical protein
LLKIRQLANLANVVMHQRDDFSVIYDWHCDCHIGCKIPETAAQTGCPREKDDQELSDGTRDRLAESGSTGHVHPNIAADR